MNTTALSSPDVSRQTVRGIYLPIPCPSMSLFYAKEFFNLSPNLTVAIHVHWDNYESPSEYDLKKK
jgi:hypothetical protein